MMILLLVIKQGPNAVFCLPNGANCVLVVSLMPAAGLESIPIARAAYALRRV
jgi:hypothetical protein